MNGDSRHMVFWSLPCGWRNYLETLLAILSKIGESRLTLDELATWASRRFKSKPEWTREALRICVVYTLLAKAENGLLCLTEEGRRFLDRRDGKMILNCLCQNIWGVREMLL